MFVVSYVMYYPDETYFHVNFFTETREEAMDKVSEMLVKEDLIGIEGREVKTKRDEVNGVTQIIVHCPQPDGSTSELASFLIEECKISKD